MRIANALLPNMIELDLHAGEPIAGECQHCHYDVYEWDEVLTALGLLHEDCASDVFGEDTDSTASLGLEPR